MMFQRIATFLLLAVVFLLPWQTRWIFASLQLGGEAWEYGQLSLYATELLVLAAGVMRGWPKLIPGAQNAVRCGVLFLGVCFVGAGMSRVLPLALVNLMHLLFAGLLFMLLLDERVRSRDLAFAFVSGLVVPAILGWIQVLTGTSPAASWFGLASHEAGTLGASVVETNAGRLLRAYGPLPHPNIFGGYLAAGTLVLSWLISTATDRRERLVCSVLVVVLISTLVVTFSRSAWLGALLGLVVLLCVRLWQRSITPHTALPHVGFGAAVALLTLVVFQTAVFTRVAPQARLEAQSIAERQQEYGYADDVILMNPFLGVGPGGYTSALAEVIPGFPVWSYQPLHNTVLLLLAEVGAFGFLACAIWILAVVRTSWRATRTLGGAYALGLGAVLLPPAFFDHYLWDGWYGLALVVFCLALTMRWSAESAKVST